MRKSFDNKLLSRSTLLIYIFLLFIFVVIKLYRGLGFIINDQNHIIQDRLEGYWNINLVPFKTIKNSNLINILGNTIPFIILGLLISIAEKRFKLIKSFAFCFILILSFELIQFITCVGFFDVDDIILNAFSSLIGIILYCSVKKLYFKDSIG